MAVLHRFYCTPYFLCQTDQLQIKAKQLYTDFFQKINFFKIFYQEYNWSSNSFDPDQDQHSVGPDLGPNCLQRSSADNKIFH